MNSVVVISPELAREQGLTARNLNAAAKWNRTAQRMAKSRGHTAAVRRHRLQAEALETVARAI